MSASRTEICNLALAHLGVGKPIGDIDTDKDKSAQACRLFYSTALRATLRDFAWPFATKFKTLALISTNPNQEWNYEYEYPSDCLKVRRILPETHTRIPYRILNNKIYSNVENAEIEYTAFIETVEDYPDDFVLAFSRRLAVYIAPMVTGGDPFKLQEKNLLLYVEELRLARANSINEEQLIEDIDGELNRVRFS